MKPELTQDRVKELFDYNDGNIYWRVRKRKVKLGDVAGCLYVDSKRPTHYTCVDMYTYLTSRIIFLWHHGYLPKYIDHIDRDRTNNRIENLRESTISQNNANRTKSKNTRFEYIGVEKRVNVFRAVCLKDGVTLRSKGFRTKEEAALAYNKLAVIQHGEFANLNIIKP